MNSLQSAVSWFAGVQAMVITEAEELFDACTSDCIGTDTATNEPNPIRIVKPNAANKTAMPKRAADTSGEKLQKTLTHAVARGLQRKALRDAFATGKQKEVEKLLTLKAEIDFGEPIGEDKKCCLKIAREMGWHTVEDLLFERLATLDRASLMKLLKSEPFANYMSVVGLSADYFLTQERPELAEQELLNAAEKGDLDKVRLLSLFVRSVDCRGIDGHTPLHLATVDRNNNFKCWIDTRLKIVKALLDRGANPNLLNGKKQSPLYIPVQNHWTPCVKLLLERGASPNLPNYNGVLPLHYAIYEHERSRELVELLLKHGASVEMAKKLDDCWKRTYQNAHPSVKELLGPDAGNVGNVFTSLIARMGRAKLNH